jgi:hypothetical protein
MFFYTPTYDYDNAYNAYNLHHDEKLVDTRNKTNRNDDTEKKRPNHHDPFVRKLYTMGMFLDVPDDWHALARERESEFQRSLSAWVNAHDPKDKAIAERVSRHVRYVTDSEFRTAFADSVRWAIDAIITTNNYHDAKKHDQTRNNNNKNHRHGGDSSKNQIKRETDVIPVHMMASPFKSSAWLSKVAWETIISGKAKGPINKKIELAGCIAVTEDDHDALEPKFTRNHHHAENIYQQQQYILYCDDASYSGEQLNQILQNLIKTWEMKLHSDHAPLKFWKRAADTHIYIAVPFMSVKASELFIRSRDVRKLIIRHEVKGTLETGIQITYKAPRDDTLTIHVNPVALQNIMAPAANALQDLKLYQKPLSKMANPNPTLTTFNHKTPDEVSFHPDVRAGRLIRGAKFSAVDRVPFLNTRRRAY